MYYHKKSLIPTRKPRNKKVKKSDNERQNTPFPKPHVAKSIQKASVGDQWHFGADPDPRIRSSD